MKEKIKKKKNLKNFFYIIHLKEYIEKIQIKNFCFFILINLYFFYKNTLILIFYLLI